MHRPFLKWAGGKQRLLKFILPHLLSGKRLIEPFVGAGAVFLNTDYPSYLLADTNPNLISLYHILQKEKEDFIQYSRQFFNKENNQEKNYYDLRSLFNQTTDDRLKAALFIYLNRHGYNGLCRYNSQGIFNVPFGRYLNPIFPEQAMRYLLLKINKITFIQEDFATTLLKAKKGDVIYCDPPYIPLSKTAKFTSYTQINFNKERQLELAVYAEKLAKKGIPVIISNHYTDFTKNAYAKAQIFSFEVNRSISRDINNRNAVQELLAVFT